jgi:hypothetical protein
MVMAGAFRRHTLTPPPPVTPNHYLRPRFCIPILLCNLVIDAVFLYAANRRGNHWGANERVIQALLIFVLTTLFFSLVVCICAKADGWLPGVTWLVATTPLWLVFGCMVLMWFVASVIAAKVSDYTALPPPPPPHTIVLRYVPSCVIVLPDVAPGRVIHLVLICVM